MRTILICGATFCVGVLGGAFLTGRGGASDGCEEWGYIGAWAMMAHQGDMPMDMMVSSLRKSLPGQEVPNDIFDLVKVAYDEPLHDGAAGTKTAVENLVERAYAMCHNTPA